MEQRQLGEEGPRVGALGLGCMGMSEVYGRADPSEAVAVIHQSLDAGANLLDTADMYGPYTNEELVGRAIADRREQAVVATKFATLRGPDGSFRGIRGDAAYVHEACEASLRRLRVDYIDVYFLHRVDPQTPIEETVGAMSLLVDQGKVRHLGLVEAGAETLRRAAAVHPIAALQSEWSLWSRDIEAEVIATCRELGVGIVAASPLGRGFLTGRFRAATDFEPGDYRATNPRFSDEAFPANLAVVDVVREIASSHGASAAQVALAWTLSRGQDVVPIPGTKRAAFLLDNLKAVELALTDDELARLDPLAAQVVGDRYADMSTIGR
ncbi:MAG: aldo/keto reductase [Myxococcota bacterium]